jgi:hypothetical protein
MARRKPLALLPVIVPVAALGALVGACSASGGSTASGGAGRAIRPVLTLEQSGPIDVTAEVRAA